MDSGIYVLVTPGNGRVYIGSSNSLLRRKREHVSALKRNIHHCMAMQKAFNKFEGEIYFTVIEYCEKEKLIEREQVWIDISSLIWIKKIYNTSLIAGRPDFSEETRKKMSNSQKNRAPISEETRILIAENSRKMWETRIRTRSEETKNKIRIARAKQIMKPLSAEHKEKIIEANKKRKGVKVSNPASLANLREGAKKRSKTALL